MKKVIVLGGGLVGKVMAADLSKDYEVTVADINQTALEELQKQFKFKTVVCNLSEKEKLKEMVKPFDLVVGSVPGFLGFETVKTVIEAGKNIVDISFFP